MSSDLGKTLNLMLNPAGMLAGTPELPSFLEKNPLFKNKGLNAAVYNTALSGATYLGLAYAIRKLINSGYTKKWDAEKQQIQETKLNALLPLNTPNARLDDIDEETKRRQTGLGKQASDSIFEDGGVFDLKNHLLYTPLPIIAGLGAVLAGRHIADTQDVEARVNDMKDKIAKRRNELAKLQGELLTKQYANGMSKEAEDKTALEKAKRLAIGDETHKSIFGSTMSAASVTAWLLALLAGGATYMITDSQDTNKKRYKALRNLTAYNLTNIPENVVLDSPIVDKLKTKSKREESIPVADTFSMPEIAASDAPLISALTPPPDIKAFDIEKAPTASEGLFS